MTVAAQTLRSTLGGFPLAQQHQHSRQLAEQTGRPEAVRGDPDVRHFSRVMIVSDQFFEEEPITTDYIQHLNVKIFVQDPASIDLAGAIPVFHRWIQDSVCHELLIDVADYRHVPAGPGVLLIGHEANYSLDQSFHRLGLLYNRKLPIEGSIDEKLGQAFRSALIACQRLEAEALFSDKLKFNAGECEVIVNDRLLAPNTERMWLALEPDFQRFFDRLFGTSAYSMERLGESRERLRVGVKTQFPIEVQSLLE